MAFCTAGAHADLSAHDPVSSITPPSFPFFSVNGRRGSGAWSSALRGRMRRQFYEFQVTPHAEAVADYEQYAA